MQLLPSSPPRAEARTARVSRPARRFSGLAAAVLAVVIGGLSGTAHAQCVDEKLKEELIGRRAYRGVVPRLFKKSLRHEVSAFGGWYAADLGDGSPAFGGAYTFHFTE